MPDYDLTPYARCRIAMEQVGAVLGSLEPGSCLHHGLLFALAELEDLAADLEPKE